MGTGELQIPTLRQGRVFPSPLEPRRRVERVLLAVVQDASRAQGQHRAAVIAVRVQETREREVLGFDVGAGETSEVELEFLRRLVAQGLKAVRLLISDAHERLKRAIAEVRAGASGQRCRVHVLRNRLTRAPAHAQSVVAALVRTIVTQRDPAARQQREHVAASVERYSPQAATGRPRAATEEVVASMDVPPAYRAMSSFRRRT